MTGQIGMSAVSMKAVGRYNGAVVVLRLAIKAKLEIELNNRQKSKWWSRDLVVWWSVVVAWA